MSFFDEYNRQRANGTYQEPERNATWRDAEAAIRQTNPALYEAVQQQRLVDQWNSYVYAQLRREQEELDAYTHGRGNRSYLRESMAEGSSIVDYERQKAQEMAARRESAGANAWDSFLDLAKTAAKGTVVQYLPKEQRQSWMQELTGKLDSLKQASKDRSSTYNWAGRDALVKEYQELQKRIAKVENGNGYGLAYAQAAQSYNADKKRLQEIQTELERKDAEYGNGKQPYSFMDRAGAFFSGTAKNLSGSLVSTGTTLADYIDRTRQTKKVMSDFLKNPEAGVETQTIRDAQNAAYRSDDQREKWDALYGTAKQLGEDAAADLDKAKGGLGFGGRALVDIGTNVIQMGFDRALSAVTGGSALVPMAARVFGQGAQEARNAGATLNQQIGYGLSSAAIELATEKISDGVALIYGEGVADEVTEKLIGRLAKSDTGRSFLRLVAGGVGEGAEEVVSDLLSPLAESIYKDESVRELYSQLSLEDILYDYFIGAAIGTLGGATNYVNGTNTQKNSELRMIDEQRAQQQAAREAGIGSVSNQVDAAWDVLTKRVTPEQQQTRAAAAPEAMGITPRQAQIVEQYQNAPQEVREAANQRARDEQAGSLATTVFSGSGITLDENQRGRLMGTLNDNDISAKNFAIGTRDAYNMGEQGATMEETVQAMGEKYGLSPKQARTAWSFGASNAQTSATGTADVSTEEGRTQVESALSFLGERTEDAVKLYDSRQDVGRMATAMNKAVLYAAHGADVQQAVQNARDGKAADVVGVLTDEQAKLAQEIGQEKRARQQAADKALGESYREMRKRAAAITGTARVSAQALEAVDTAIDATRKAGQRVMDEFNALYNALEALEKADPNAKNSVTYKEMLDRAYKLRDKAQNAQKQIRELEKRKAQIEGKKTIQRKKGTVSFGGGTIEGVKYDGVDTAKLSRQQQKVVAMVERLADAVNLDYVFISADAGMGGAYTFGGRVYININAGLGVGNFSQTMAAASLSHEMTHWMQQYAPEEYSQLKDFIVQEILKADPVRLQKLIQQQKAWEKGRALTDEQALDEVVANACQTMLLDSKAINKLARQNMSLAARIADWIADWSQKVKDAFAEVDTSQGAIYEAVRALDGSLDRIQELWDNGIEAAAQNYDAQQTTRADVAQKATNENAAQRIGAKNQYIGESAETADKDALALARQLDNQGVDNEAIRQQTGWFKGMDGKWRFEIDDSELEYFPQGDAQFRKDHPEYAEYQRLMNKLLTGQLSKAEEKRLRKLDSTWGNAKKNLASIVENGRARLGMLIRHDTLFDAYPYLADTRIVFRDMNANGSYSEEANRISLNTALKKDPENLKKTLVHEIQHAIQTAEGFAPGSSVEAWADRAKREEKNAKQRFKRARERFVDVLAKDSEIIQAKADFDAGKISETELDQVINKAQKAERFKEYRDKIIQEFKKATDIEAKGAYYFYENTAGEIEARDVTARLKYSPLERLAVAPNLGDENTVFADRTQFQMIGEVEETPRLVAVHNKSVSGLRRMLQRGGVPFPSIAIKKAGTSHEGFGDVSIVFPKSSIDPQVNRQNRLYSNDAWTPTEPRTEYDVGDMWRYMKKLRKEIGDRIYDGLKGGSYLEEDEIAKKLMSSNGDIFEALKDITVLKYAYLKSIGKEPTLPEKTTTLDGFGKYKNEQLLAVFDALTDEEIQNMSYDTEETLKKVSDALNEQFMKQFEGKYDSTKLAALRKMSPFSPEKINPRIIQDAYYRYKDMGIRNEIDFYAFDRELRNNDVVNAPGYRDWIESRFKDLIVNEGIPNGKDLFTDSGNRRSFKQRHVPATLENIVKQMQKEQEKGIGVFGVNLRGAATKTYRTVEEMRADSGKLLGTHISDDVYDSYMNGFHERLHNMSDEAAGHSSDWSAQDSAEQILLETLRDAKSKAAMSRMLDNEARWIKVTPELKESLWQLKQDVQNMPAPYFEAKPRRIVYPEEALAYILPDNADSDVMKALEDRGYNVMTYKAGDEKDRLRKLNSVEGAQFQRWDDTDGDTAAESNGREEAYTRLQSENKAVEDTIAALRKLTEKQGSTIERLRKRLRLTTTPEVREADARKLARNLVKEYGSGADVSGITEQLKTLGDYVAQTKDLNADEVKNRAREIARGIVESASEQVSFEDETIANIRGRIKGKKLTISPDFLGELDQENGFDAFRKRNFGAFTLARADSTSIDRSEYTSVSQFYTDLQSEYGTAYFPDLANEGEEIRTIAALARAAAPMEVNPFEQYMGEATEELANRISMEVMDGALRLTPATDADKAKSRREALQERIRELQREGKIQEREAKDYERTIQELTDTLDKAQSRYRTLQVTAEQRMAQVRAEGRARQTEIKAKEREKAAENIKALKDHFRDMSRKARERRTNTATRRNIRKLIADLNNRLKHPTENKHIPRELMQITLDVLNMIDMDTGRGGTQAAQKIADIRAMYEEYKNNPTYQIAYDETTADMLDQLALTLRGTRLADMNDLQLKAVHDTLKSLIHVIDTAVRIKIGTEEYNAYELSREMTMETRAVPKAQRGWLREHLIPAHLRADVAFRRFGGFKKNSKWEQAAKLLNDGQLKETRLKMELSRPFAEIFNDEKALADFTGVNALGKVDTKKLVDIGLKDANGETILVNHDLMVGIYMDLLNEDNRRHFINGGKTIPNIADFYSGKGGWGAGAQRSAGIAERLSELNRQLSEAERTNYGEWADDLKEQIAALKSEGEQYADYVQAAIESKLTDYDREWIAACKQLMDVDSKRELNRTTMDVYGIEKASVPDYWPITSDPDFLSKPMETVTKDMSLENVGFMKDRIKGANPSLALGTVNVVTRQIDRVSHYCGMMPALRSFGKIWNKTEAGYADSIKKATREVFQDSGVKYVENLIADLTGGRTIDRDILGLDAALGKLRGNLAQTSLTLNPRVAMAQAASYPTAAAELGWGPLAKALARGGKNGQIISRADTDLIAKWSPLLYHRMQGYSSPELGDIQSSTSASSKLWRKARWITGWIQAVDGATVGRLWYAAEYWVQDNKPTLQKGSDAYYEAVAEKFNAVVEKTQPNYTPMQRAAILREPSNLVKTFTMFMTQRLQNYNILYDAAGSYQKARADFANGRNGVTQADVSEARQNVARAVTSQLAQAAVYVGFKVLADALLHNMKKYRDKDTGDFTAESVSKAILDAYLEAWMGIEIFGSELYSIIKAVTGVSKWYGLSVSGVDSVNDLIENVVNLSQNDWSSDNGKAKGLKALLKVGTSLAQFFGLPAENGIKIGEAVYYHIEDAANGEFFSFEAGYERTKAQNTEKLIRALESGDKEQISAMAGAFEDEKAAISAVKERFGKDYKAGKMDSGEIEELLTRAGMEADDAYFAATKIESGNDSRYTPLKTAMITGDKQGFAQELKALTSHGVEEKDAVSALKTFLKNVFTGKELSEDETKAAGEKKITESEAQKLLQEYCGMEENAAYLTVKSWETGDDGKYIAAQRAAFTGDQTAFKAEMQDLTGHGVKEKDVHSAVKGFVRDAFMGKDLSEEQSEIVGDHKLTEAEARKMLHYYAGLSVDDANKTVAGWKEDMRIAEKYGAEYEEYDLTTAQAKYFYEGDAKGKVSLSEYANQIETYGMDRMKAYYGADGWRQTGLTMDQYDKYASEASKCKGVDNDGDGKADANSVKNQKLAIINSLPVSTAVKDAIYRKNNWAESGLKNTPWH